MDTPKNIPEWIGEFDRRSAEANAAIERFAELSFTSSCPAPTPDQKDEIERLLAIRRRAGIPDGAITEGREVLQGAAEKLAAGIRFAVSSAHEKYRDLLEGIERTLARLAKDRECRSLVWTHDFPEPQGVVEVKDEKLGAMMFGILGQLDQNHWLRSALPQEDCYWCGGPAIALGQSKGRALNGRRVLQSWLPSETAFAITREWRRSQLRAKREEQARIDRIRHEAEKESLRRAEAALSPEERFRRLESREGQPQSS